MMMIAMIVSIRMEIQRNLMGMAKMLMTIFHHACSFSFFQQNRVAIKNNATMLLNLTNSNTEDQGFVAAHMNKLSSLASIVFASHAIVFCFCWTDKM